MAAWRVVQLAPETWGLQFRCLKIGAFELWDHGSEVYASLAFAKAICDGLNVDDAARKANQKLKRARAKVVYP